MAEGERSSRAGSGPRVVLTPSSQNPGRLLHDAHVRLAGEFVRILRDEGVDLSAEQWGLFNFLGESGEVSQLEIGRLAGKDRHQTSRLIAALEERGYVVRVQTQEDLRVKRVRLSDAGQETRVRLLGSLTRYLEDAFRGVTQEEYDGLIRCLQHIAGHNRPKETTIDD